MTAIMAPGAGTWDVGLCEHNATPDTEFYDNNVTVFVYNGGGTAAASVRARQMTSQQTRQLPLPPGRG